MVTPDQYLGVDLDPESIAMARARHPEHQFVVPGALAALATFGFDIIVGLAVIEHLPDPAAWLRTLRAMLRPGGRIVLTTPHPWARVIHEAGARMGLFSREAQEDHEDFLGPARIVSLATAADCVVTVNRRFLMGVNQLFVLEAAAASVATTAVQ